MLHQVQKDNMFTFTIHISIESLDRHIFIYMGKEYLGHQRARHPSILTHEIQKSCGIVLHAVQVISLASMFY